MHNIIYAAPTDFISLLKSLVTDLGSVIGAGAILAIGACALMEVLRGKHGAALLIVIAGLIPALLVLDPSLAATLYRNTLQKL
jgi:hypothetical protein